VYVSSLPGDAEACSVDADTISPARSDWNRFGATYA
jgi:hypothetical protein